VFFPDNIKQLLRTDMPLGSQKDIYQPVTLFGSARLFLP
jgi:hypothetical protein